ncbi:hypothetical protein [Streptomyces mirabilis]|uniref:hypothetical protein n=1 Tax=Streptomyces mirabilis TaxID=68239 RepID=UPI0036CB2F34
MPTHSGWHAVFAACLLALALAGCNPRMYDEVPALHDAKRAEVSGSWLGYDRTNVVFWPDGKADIRLLDGQEWDFDDRWRLSGTGTWKLTDRRTGWNDGQHVQLTLASRTAVATRTPEPNEPLASPANGPQTPKTYTWTFELRRDDKEALKLYFFFGDPDSRSTYVLQRGEPQSVAHRPARRPS